MNATVTHTPFIWTTLKLSRNSTVDRRKEEQRWHGSLLKVGVCYLLIVYVPISSTWRFFMTIVDILIFADLKKPRISQTIYVTSTSSLIK